MKGVLALLCGFVLLGGMMTGCQPSAETEQRAKLDDAIHTVERGVAAFYSLGPDASPSDIRSEAERLSASWDEVEKASKGLEGVDPSNAATALQELLSTIEALPDDAQGNPPMQSVIPRVEAFRSALNDLDTAVERGASQ
jgi:hypothetical protein